MQRVARNWRSPWTGRALENIPGVAERATVTVRTAAEPDRVAFANALVRLMIHCPHTAAGALVPCDRRGEATDATGLGPYASRKARRDRRKQLLRDPNYRGRDLAETAAETTSYTVWGLRGALDELAKLSCVVRVEYRRDAPHGARLDRQVRPAPASAPVDLPCADPPARGTPHKRPPASGDVVFTTRGNAIDAPGSPRLI